MKIVLVSVMLGLSQILSALTMDDFDEYRKIVKLFDSQKYDAAIECCEAAAEKSNPYAVLSLFYIHRYGLYGRPVNVAAAQKYREYFTGAIDCEYDFSPYRSPLIGRSGTPLPGGEHPIGDCYAAAMECKSEMCGRVAYRMSIVGYDPQFNPLLLEYAQERNCWPAYTSEIIVNYFHNDLSKQQLEMLRRASDAGYVPAMVNLALALFKHDNNQLRDAVAARRYLDQAMAVFQSYLQKNCFHVAESREYRTACDLDPLIPHLEQKSTPELLAEYSKLSSKNEFVRLAYEDLVIRHNDHPTCEFFVAKRYLDHDYAGSVKLIKHAAANGSDEALVYLINDYKIRGNDEDLWYYYYLAGTKNFKSAKHANCYETALGFALVNQNIMGPEKYMDALAKLAQVYEPARKRYEEASKRCADIFDDIAISVSNPDTVMTQLVRQDGRRAIKCMFPASPGRNFVDLKIPAQSGRELSKWLFYYKADIPPPQVRIIATFSQNTGSENKLAPSLFFGNRPQSLRLICLPTPDPVEIIVGLP